MSTFPSVDILVLACPSEGELPSPHPVSVSHQHCRSETTIRLPPPSGAVAEVTVCGEPDATHYGIDSIHTSPITRSSGVVSYSIADRVAHVSGIEEGNVPGLRHGSETSGREGDNGNREQPSRSHRRGLLGETGPRPSATRRDVP